MPAVHAPAAAESRRAPASASLAAVALAALALALLPSCGRIHDRVQDVVHGWSTCEPVSEACFSDPSEFYAMPIIASQNTWRGREADELVASWGRPDSIESLGGDSYRYVWVETKTLPGEVSYQHDQWTNDWGLVRNPDQTFQCRTFMGVDASGRVTPLWVDRLGACDQYFSPRPPAPPAPGTALSGGSAAGGVLSPVPLDPPRQIRERDGI
jgi:hypothetical protein